MFFECNNRKFYFQNMGFEQFKPDVNQFRPIINQNNLFCKFPENFSNHWFVQVWCQPSSHHTGRLHRRRRLHHRIESEIDSNFSFYCRLKLLLRWTTLVFLGRQDVMPLHLLDEMRRMSRRFLWDSITAREEEVPHATGFNLVSSRRFVELREEDLHAW